MIKIATLENNDFNWGFIAEYMSFLLDTRYQPVIRYASYDLEINRVCYLVALLGSFFYRIFFFNISLTSFEELCIIYKRTR